MASDLLNVGSQSVITAQKQLNTTGHNISNANTEGYSRQSVLQAANDPMQFGGQTYGMGVHVDNVRRSWDQFAVNELNVSTTDFASKQAVESNYDLLSGMLSSVASQKVPENINEWFNSIKTLADTPNDMGARKVVLEKAGLITQNLNNFYETVRVEADNANRRLDMAVERVNQISTEIRDIHRAMMRTPAPHNDLMDQHERLVKELSTYTKVTVTPKANNEGYNVHIGNGHTIVSGTESSKLAMLNGEPDPHQRRLAIVEGKIVKPIQQLDIDGELGALFDMRDKNIPYVYDELGRVAASLAFEVNKLQHQGLDIRGQIGAQMFNDVNSERAAQDRVIKGNESKAEMAVYLEDLSQLKGGEYSLKYDGKRYAITNGRGEVTRLEPASDGALHFDGVRIEISKKPQVNEKILIRPTRMAAGELTLMMNDPAKIAAQSYESSTTFAQGTAKFDILSVGDLKEFEVIISPQGDQFAVLDTKGNVLQSPQPYPTDDVITVMGTQFTLTAGALPNDKFGANLVGSEGDNGNLRKLQDIQTSKIFNDGNSTLLQLYHNLNTDVGLKYSTASRVANVAKLEHQAAQERVASISGVNLDEEAANMMKFQNAYMASSRIMQTANDTFNTILQLR